MVVFVVYERFIKGRCSRHGAFIAETVAIFVCLGYDVSREHLFRFDDFCESKVRGGFWDRLNQCCNEVIDVVSGIGCEFISCEERCDESGSVFEDG